MKPQTLSMAIDDLDLVGFNARRVLELLEDAADELHAKHRAALTPTGKGETLTLLAHYLASRIISNDEHQRLAMQIALSASNLRCELLDFADSDEALAESDPAPLQLAIEDTIHAARQLGEHLATIDPERSDER